MVKYAHKMRPFPAQNRSVHIEYSKFAQNSSLNLKFSTPKTPPDAFSTINLRSSRNTTQSKVVFKNFTPFMSLSFTQFVCWMSQSSPECSDRGILHEQNCYFDSDEPSIFAFMKNFTNFSTIFFKKVTQNSKMTHDMKSQITRFWLKSNTAHGVKENRLFQKFPQIAYHRQMQTCKPLIL